MTSDHITAPGTLIAWHRTRDIAAVRDTDGAEHLFIDGQAIRLDRNHLHPTQLVINICSLDGRAAASLIAQLQALGQAVRP